MFDNFFDSFRTCASRQRKFANEVIERGLPTHEEPDPKKRYVRRVSSCIHDTETSITVHYYPRDTFNDFIWRNWYAARQECLFKTDASSDRIQARDGQCVHQIEHVYWNEETKKWELASRRYPGFW
jgi:hypothetical protein